MRGFISKLLELTHSQWIFCSITKHHHTNGTIKLDAKHQDTMKEIERQLNMGLASLPPESKCLLKIDLSAPFQQLTENKNSIGSMRSMQPEWPEKGNGPHGWKISKLGCDPKGWKILTSSQLPPTSGEKATADIHPTKAPLLSPSNDGHPSCPIMDRIKRERK